MYFPSDESVKGFQEMMRREYCADYTFEEAREASMNLIGFVELLLKIDRRNNPERYEKKTKETE